MQPHDGTLARPDRNITISRCVLVALADLAPREIFAFAALQHVQVQLDDGLVEASEVSEHVHEWLPPMCHVNDEFFLEALPMFLRHSKLTCVWRVRQWLTFLSQYRRARSMLCIWSVLLSPSDSHVSVRLFATLC